MSDNASANTTIDEENSVTMLDVLQEENELEEDVNAVLGDSDDKNCSYNKGYIRQALYACKTCCPQETRAAVCLACSFHCHEGHELIELYTKRHFRCDCGNSKFGDKSCSLDPTKESLNDENKYNQNFDGVYCICARPYPDPEGNDTDEMLQCGLCEDWFHSKHLGNSDDRPNDDDYSEMTCAACMKKHEFLWRYVVNLSVTKNSKKDQSISEDKVEVEATTKNCTLPADLCPNKEGSCFWVEGWRSSLCSCDNCKKMYEEHEVSFLLDPLDSVHVYEEANKANSRETQYQKGMKALASLGHVQQLTAIEEYNTMKERLKEYLQKFAENKKIVREEDIKEFFSEMAANKRPKVTMPPAYCR